MRDSRTIRLGLAVAILSMALCFVGLIVWGTWEHREYFRRNYPDLPMRAYPMVSVSGTCVLVLAEAALLWRILAGAALSIERALGAIGASAGGAVVLVFAAMLPDHTAPHVMWHFFWLLSATGLSLGAFLVLATVRLIRYLAGSRISG